MDILFDQIIDTVDENYEPIKTRLKITNKVKRYNKEIILFQLFDSVERYFFYELIDTEKFYINIKKNNTPEIKISYNKKKTNVWVDIFIEFSKDVCDMVILSESYEFSLNSIEDDINQLENKLIELKKQKQIYESIIL
jgi:hypothetical protein